MRQRASWLEVSSVSQGIDHPRGVVGRAPQILPIIVAERKTGIRIARSPAPGTVSPRNSYSHSLSIYFISLLCICSPFYLKEDYATLKTLAIDSSSQFLFLNAVYSICMITMLVPAFVVLGLVSSSIGVPDRVEKRQDYSELITLWVSYSTAQATI